MTQTIHIKSRIYPYKTLKILTPIIERTNNGLIFPEGIKPDMDTEQLKNRN